MSDAESKSGIVDFSEVLNSELDAISLRRKRAAAVPQEDEPPSEAKPDATTGATPEEHFRAAERRALKQDLIGLALSGGGVRSASTCLGALQGLCRRGVLRWIDYMSTVSGGGYAGAYLSSLALSPDQSFSNQPTAGSSATPGKVRATPEKTKCRLSDALGTGVKQPPAVRNLIGSGNFLLKKTLNGSNRVIFGMFLIWVLVGSGLVAATSLAAYLYRMLDAVPCRQFLAVLGISDQLTLDLFPPLVMFLVYLLIWGVTYWRSGSASPGIVARWWLASTIVVSLVALATLMGSGNVTVDTVAWLIGAKPSDWIREGLTGLSNVIVPLVVVGLVPWLLPKKVFQSGDQEQSGIKHWIFRISSWALLGGVPFLLVAHFAYEGIGGSQTLMDDRLRVPEVKDWDRTPFAPLWLSLRGEHVLAHARVSNSEPADASKPENIDGKRTLGQIWAWLDQGRLDHSPVSTKDGLFLELAKHYGERTKYELKKEIPLERLTPGDEWTWQTRRLGALTRWYYLMEYTLGCTLGLDALEEYQFARILKEHEDIHNLKERIVFRMNQLLLRTDFYKYFPDMEDMDNMLPAPGIVLNKGKDDAEWRENVQRLLHEAKAVSLSFTPDESEKTTDVKDSLGLSDLPKNAGTEDTPWLIELRPRWALLPENVKEEVSTDRAVLKRKRIREEQSFYPLNEYALGNVVPLRDAESTDEKELREAVDAEFAHSLNTSVRSRLLAAQTDSFYIVKRWSQVEKSRDLREFRKEIENREEVRDLSAERRVFPARVAWSVLLSDAWRELPWRGPSATTVRDVDIELQRIITAQSYKMRRMLEVNRQLLEAYFPGMIASKDTKPFSYMVLERDQAARWGWFCWSLACFLIVGTILDLNFTSWHGFYAERIGSTWINPAAGVGSQIPLAQLRTAEEGLPYHVISASLNPFERRVGEHNPTELFLLSQLFAGSDSTGYRRTGDFRDENYNLASAVAISGGAVSPVHVSNPVLSVLLFLGNFRLGQWIQNPGFRQRRSRLVEWLGHNTMISPLRFLIGWFRPLSDRMYCFVTDGGLTENLGIRQLIRRRCKLILAIDAGQDGRFQFHDLAKLLRWVQVDDGVRMTWMNYESTDLEERARNLKLQPLSLTPVMATGVGERSAGENGSQSSASQGRDPYGRPLNPDAAQHYLIARIEYPGYDQAKTNEEREASTGYLVYMKSTVCEDDPMELVNYQKANPLFPHDPTTDLAFGPDQFESYRHLGEHTVESTLNAIKGAAQAKSGLELIEAVRHASGLSSDSQYPGELVSESGLDTSEPNKSVEAEASATSAEMAGDSPKSFEDDSLVLAGSMPSHESELAHLEDLKRIVLGHEDLWTRKGAAHEFEGHPDQQREVIEALVLQLHDENSTGTDDVHNLLLGFRAVALPALRAGLKGLDKMAQLRRLKVIADILIEDFDSATAEFLLDWLGESPSRKVQREIQRLFGRIPFDSYSSTDQRLKERVAMALHSR